MNKKRISKDAIKRAMFKPAKDFYMEKINSYIYKLHFTPSDAHISLGLLNNKFKVTPDGKGFHGSAYLIENF